MFQASVHVTLRPSILDPKGKASEQALHQLGLKAIQDVRIGKLITMNVEAATEEEANKKVEEACQKLLANDVMEDVEIEMKRVAHDTSQ
ncbi:MAG TPA: phosphoribosylformylglycinamidine synthase [Bacteroidetes bacterium]|nr:MAG: phosphoribosylformylglycinamidine synthase subunit PurS [Rhodothermaceae bacterium TMED105]HBD42113.1 phosphoribosylformylglycinamidine synthase [Bacteroidota bacterium]HBW00206.1 phosphoribosylformylglycinamidine synthase [Bacteroidota bacterium]|tara:strand:- start:423 stop:689 length:267 start_codon:yes stop_codon:yes gene_type:complete